MSTRLFEHVQDKQTPQTEPIPGKPMVANSAGGYAFAVDDWKRLERFLVLGSEGGTYYVTERKLTQENAACVERCVKGDCLRAVKLMADISDAGRAPKNDPAVFAYALACKFAPAHMKADVYGYLPKIVRTGTHLFQFAAACNALRGWGAGLRKAVAKWYSEKDAESLGYQLAKYQQRDGWSHRDVLRLCHVRGESPGRVAALRWAATGETNTDLERTVTRGKGDKAVTRTYAGASPVNLPLSILALESLKKAKDADDCAKMLREFRDKATREMVPTQFLSSPNVWEALLDTMPMTAMLRNLGNMTKCGLLAPLSNAANTVCDRLRDSGRLKSARVHPLAVLVALKTYAQGKGVKGSGEWEPVQQVVDALNDAFYLAFDAVESTHKRWVFGLDVSGSMSSLLSNMPISCAEGTAALSMVSVRTEPYTFIGGFADCFREIRIGRSTRLDDALKCVQMSNFGRTDCAVPVQHAMDNGIQADVFCVLTDSETYAGNIHPSQALRRYREKTGIPAKMIVVGMASNGFTISDPSDAGMLDVCGFDTSVPAVMSDFARS